MPNYIKTNPVGLDKVIDIIQKRLYDKLTPLWNIKLEGYPRCYEVKRAKKVTVEHYKGKGEYESLIHSDTNKFFFIVKDDIKQVSYTTYNAVIELYFILNIQDCKPSIHHRADEEVRNEVINVLSTIGVADALKTIIIDTPSVFRGYDYELLNDMHPHDCFKVIFEIRDFKLK